MLSLKQFALGVLVAIPCWAQSGAVHQVRSGDSLWKLQERYGVPWQRIQRANNLSSTTIRIGQRLRIPGSSTTVAASAPTPTSTPSASSSFEAAKLALRNGLSALIQERNANPAPPAQTTRIYTVRSGDSLSKIGSRFGVSVSNLRSMNGIPSNSSLIRVGQRLRINRAGYPRRLSIRYHAPMRYTQDELVVLARIVKGECPHFMSFEGKVAVAAVLLNRVRRSDGVFAKDRSITRAAHRPAQFSCYNSDKRAQLYYGSVPQWAYDAARAALAGIDPTQGSTHYYNPFLVSPGWAKRFTAVLQLGENSNDSHLFFHTPTNRQPGASQPTWAYSSSGTQQ